MAHCGSIGSDPTLPYTEDSVEFSYHSLDLHCHNYNETSMTTTPPHPYSVYPAFSPDEELGYRSRTEQGLVFMDYPQVHHLKKGTTELWTHVHPPQFLKTQSRAAPAPLHEISEHLTDWNANKITPPVSPSHHDQSNEHEPEGLCIPFVPINGRKRRRSSKSGGSQSRNSRNTSTRSPDLRSPGPGAASPGSNINSTEGSIMYQLLYELRETRQLSWKACAAEVIKEHGKAYKVPALQMRYKRLKEKAVAWGPEDVKRLQQAELIVKARIEENKMIWIAEEMLKLGGENSRPYTPSSCEKKLRELGTLAMVSEVSTVHSGS
ncbi:hypothetical protein EV426DRAFT_572299 [Tirmania nivea]|nr:hypothetical protein EV426DRAFT_572299 [Tirmania nivea]